MKKANKILGICLLIAACLLQSCSQESAEQKKYASTNTTTITPTTRIVSLNGTLTEILCNLGYEQNISGVDVTSTYPESILNKPKVGHNRNLSAEAIIALKPDVVLGVKEYTNPALLAQLNAAHARVFVFDPKHSIAGAKELIQAVADSLQYKGNIREQLAAIDADKSTAETLTSIPKVLFIYARGAGTLMAAGTNTAVNSMIEITGAKNAVTTYENFKPLTTEAMVAANPDIILLFDSGLASLGGIDGLLKIPGVGNTNAGRNKKVIEMDGQFLTGFGPRTGKAIALLSKKLNEAIKP